MLLFLFHEVPFEMGISNFKKMVTISAQNGNHFFYFKSLFLSKMKKYGYDMVIKIFE